MNAFPTLYLGWRRQQNSPHALFQCNVSGYCFHAPPISPSQIARGFRAVAGRADCSVTMHMTEVTAFQMNRRDFRPDSLDHALYKRDTVPHGRVSAALSP